MAEARRVYIDPEYAWSREVGENVWLDKEEFTDKRAFSYDIGVHPDKDPRKWSHHTARMTLASKREHHHIKLVCSINDIILIILGKNCQ